MTDWPRHLSRPLVEAQACDVLAWGAAGTHLVPLVTIICARCGEAVARVDEFQLDTPDGRREIEINAAGRWVTLGAVLRADQRADIAPEFVRDLPRDLRPGQYLALLDVPSARALPAVLPLWCARHGALTIERSRLDGIVRAGKASGATRTVRVRTPRG